MAPISKITLVIPCYNEASRLDFAEFLKHPQINFIFVDDGSEDGTAELLQGHVLRLSPNRGKAEAVRLGMLKALETFPESDWLGFWDADLATPLHEIPLFLTYVQTFYPNAESVWGSRVYRLGSRIHRSALRHYLGRGFATIISHALKVEAYDTQCGAKLFRPGIVKKAFLEPFISRWIFDVEILLRIGQERVVEYPLLRWEDVAGSKVKISREVFRVLAEIWAIRRKYIK